MYINWKKIGLYTVDIGLGAYLIAAFTVFNKTDEINRLCNQVDIQIENKTDAGFITKEEITTRLERAGLYPKMKPLKAVSSRNIEDNLKKTPFVNTAECYKSQDDVVHIYLTQRMPTLRIKSVNGDDYYLDDNTQIMPNSSYTSDLIIASGYISKKFAQNYVAPLASTIISDDFWEKQIEQIYVGQDQAIELIPRVGEHIVYIGRLPESDNPQERKKLIADFIHRKLNRLEKFYRYGLSQSGWNKYAVINLEFDNQIICKKAANTK